MPNHTAAEIASQPEVWSRVLGRAREVRPVLAAPGERVLVLGCGTSWHVAGCLARLREDAGLGETHYGCAADPPRRRYDRVLAISRSGTTTEVLDALRGQPAGTRRVAVTASAGTPLAELADDVVLLAEADERSVVQTRFPTAVVALARAVLGGAPDGLVAAASAALADPLPVRPEEVDQVVFLGTGWTVGLAHEAALKIREAAGGWAESYPATEFRHGPAAAAGARSLVWALGPLPAGLVDLVGAAGARLRAEDRDPLAELVLAQRLAVAWARSRGRDPDRPRLLTRSVILDRPVTGDR